MCKLLILGFVDTVAIGFSSASLYDGPSCWLGALISGDGLPDSDILRSCRRRIEGKKLVGRYLQNRGTEAEAGKIYSRARQSSAHDRS